MSVGTFIQWLALALCVIFAAMRLPDALRGKGRSVFAVLVLLSVAVALSLAPIYLFVDGLLGGANIANLLIRFSLYAIMLLLGMRVAAAFGSTRALTFIRGPIGIAVLGLTVVGTAILFVLSDLPESSTGLRAYADQATVHWYSHMGRIYPAYVSVCLLGSAIARARDTSARGLHRVATALMAVGFTMVIAHTVLQLIAIRTGAADLILPFGAIVLVTTGLTMIWLSRRSALKERSVNFLADEQRRF
jgi:hypothetical protein